MPGPAAATTTTTTKIGIPDPSRKTQLLIPIGIPERIFRNNLQDTQEEYLLCSKEKKE
jgi:hypothetical protein